MALGRIESQELCYMPAAMTADAVTADCNEQPQTGIANTDSSAAVKQAMLLSQIHSRRFRE